ncbi:WYL domain-containing protein [Streptomyces sp. Lzd4kr]|nr:WYL domain-containing protein [Streptomyces sp. Lzd4kr]
MRRTANETTTQTLTRLIKALDAKHPVTITYTKADGTETIRTIEIQGFDISQAGDILVKALDRETGEMRTWRLDRIQAYTVHRTAYVIEAPAVDDKPAHPAYELAATTAPHAAHLSTTARLNNLAAAFAA